MSHHLKWKNIDYLREPEYFAGDASAGNQLVEIIDALSIESGLRIFLPTLVGAHALGLAGKQQPVRFVCEVYARESFVSLCEEKFSTLSRYQLVDIMHLNVPSAAVRFKREGWKFEILGCTKPVEDHPLFQATVALKRMLDLQELSANLRKQLFERLTDADFWPTMASLFELTVASGKARECELQTLAAFSATLDWEESELIDRLTLLPAAQPEPIDQVISSEATTASS